MKDEVKEYVDQQIDWVRDLKRTENYWLEKYLESEQRAQKEMILMNNESTEVFKRQTNEWKDRMEHAISQTITRREMRSIMIAVVTILITFLGLLVAIFIRK